MTTEEEERTLSELREAQSVPYWTRDRAHRLWLNAQGSNVPAIANIFQCHQHTVKATLRRWESDGLGGLWEAPGRGAKPKWQPSDLDYLTACLDEEPRTYTKSCLATPDSIGANGICPYGLAFIEPGFWSRICSENRLVPGG